MQVLAVIPARYASTRLPGKPLLDIGGQPMIEHVYKRVSCVKGVDSVIVATDDPRIVACVQGFGGIAIMTSSSHACGTDRLQEVAAAVSADIYINVQGDEPLIEPAAIETLVSALEDPEVQVATLCCAISKAEAASPHLVKVVRAHNGDALYFSRSMIPFERDEEQPASYWGHVGVYAYRAAVLQRFGALPASHLEHTEKLEQLRLLQSGIPVRVLEVPPMPSGVDTVEDLARVRAVVQEKKKTAALAKIPNIRLLITDVDGILTDGSLYYGPDGEYLKKFNARDGLAIKLFQQEGLEVAVLSGRDCPALRARMRDLGIKNFIVGQSDKKAVIHDFIRRCGVSPDQVAYVGDDTPDAKVFSYCAVAVTVAEAPESVRQAADLILDCPSGQGVLRALYDIFRGVRTCS